MFRIIFQDLMLTIIVFSRLLDSLALRSEVNQINLNIIDPHLDLEVETGGDSRFSVFLGSRSKFTLGAEKKGYLHLSPLQDPDVDH